LSDQKFVLAPAKRLTGGFNGPFFLLLPFLSSVGFTSLTRPRRCGLGRALLRVIAVTASLQNPFSQALAISALPPARFGRRRAPACALVRRQSVKIFDDFDSVPV
jgi:hypothetical protein